MEGTFAWTNTKSVEDDNDTAAGLCSLKKPQFPYFNFSLLLVNVVPLCQIIKTLHACRQGYK